MNTNEEPHGAASEGLDQVLDRLMAGDPAAASRLAAADPALGLDAFLAVARLVEQSTAVTPSPATTARHVRMLMDTAGALAGAQVGAAPRRSFRRRRLIAAIGSVAGLLLVGAPATAALAAHAQPGQALYGTKLLVERIQLAMQPSQASDLSLRMRFAHERVEEIAGLLARGNPAPLPAVEAELAATQAEVESGLAQLESRGMATTSLVSTLAGLARPSTDRLSQLAQQAGCDDNPGEHATCTGLLTARAGSDRIVRRLDGDRADDDTRGRGSGGSGTPGDDESPSPATSPSSSQDPNSGSGRDRSGNPTPSHTPGGKSGKGSGGDGSRSGGHGLDGSTEPTAGSGDTSHDNDRSGAGPVEGPTLPPAVGGDGGQAGTPAPAPTGGDADHSGGPAASPTPTPNATQSPSGGGSGGGKTSPPSGTSGKPS